MELSIHDEAEIVAKNITLSTIEAELKDASQSLLEVGDEQVKRVVEVLKEAIKIING